MARFRCEVCDYVYDEDAGAPREGFPAGTAWADVPDDWACPDCGVREKVDFIPEDVVLGTEDTDGDTDGADGRRDDAGLTDG